MSELNKILSIIFIIAAVIVILSIIYILYTIKINKILKKKAKAKKLIPIEYYMFFGSIFIILSILLFCFIVYSVEKIPYRSFEVTVPSSAYDFDIMDFYDQIDKKADSKEEILVEPHQSMYIYIDTDGSIIDIELCFLVKRKNFYVFYAARYDQSKNSVKFVNGTVANEKFNFQPFKVYCENLSLFDLNILKDYYKWNLDDEYTLEHPIYLSVGFGRAEKERIFNYDTKMINADGSISVFPGDFKYKGNYTTLGVFGLEIFNGLKFGAFVDDWIIFNERKE